MKTYNKPSASKLVTRFDQELLEILRADLKALKAKSQFINKTNNNLLPAA